MKHFGPDLAASGNAGWDLPEGVPTWHGWSWTDCTDTEGIR